MIDTTTYNLRLKEELEEVINQLQSLGITNPDVPGDWIAVPPQDETREADENVLADQAEEWSNRTAILDDLETRYNNIKRALAKIENGTYGVCEISGEPIEPERLDANPAARTCKAHLEEESSLSKT